MVLPNSLKGKKGMIATKPSKAARPKKKVVAEDVVAPGEDDYEGRPAAYELSLRIAALQAMQEKEDSQFSASSLSFALGELESTKNTLMLSPLLGEEHLSHLVAVLRVSEMESDGLSEAESATLSQIKEIVQTIRGIGPFEKTTPEVAAQKLLFCLSPEAKGIREFAHSILQKPVLEASPVAPEKAKREVSPSPAKSESSSSKKASKKHPQPSAAVPATQSPKEDNQFRTVRRLSAAELRTRAEERRKLQENELKRLQESKRSRHLAAENVAGRLGSPNVKAASGKAAAAGKK